MRFKGKKVLVTGGNSGIGFATAKEFVREGAEVLITGRDEKTLAQAQTELGAAVTAIRSGASDLGQLADLAAQIGKKWGALDAAFINAGVGEFVPIAEVTEKHFDQIIGTNVKGPYFLIQKILPFFKNGGSIVLNGSVAAQLGMANASVYSASKAAIVSLGKTLGSELADRKIRVNVVSPGPVDTPILARNSTPEQVAQTKAGLTSMVPMKRMGDPVEIARAVLFLASSEASFVTGADILVDGGAAL